MIRYDAEHTTCAAAALGVAIAAVTDAYFALIHDALGV